MLVVSELSKSYPTAGEPLSVLRGVNLELSPGQSAAIVGPSGSGKTT
ncbi:MAG: ATP-binding cassette domain-containing protein, partial [Rhodopirellula bahusiensis]